MATMNFGGTVAARVEADAGSAPVPPVDPVRYFPDPALEAAVRVAVSIPAWTLGGTNPPTLTLTAPNTYQLSYSYFSYGGHVYTGVSFFDGVDIHGYNAPWSMSGAENIDCYLLLRAGMFYITVYYEHSQKSNLDAFLPIYTGTVEYAAEDLFIPTAGVYAYQGNPAPDIHQSDLDLVTSFTASSLGIVDLTGMEYWITLTYLDFSNNVIIDVSPLASLTGLTYLNCNTNAFSGTLPSFATYTALINFDCSSNTFSGTLPSFAACTALTEFSCYINAFSGTLPSFAACTALEKFFCFENAFSGTLPSFAACTALTYFDCYTNAFSGYIAGSFATQANLDNLNMSDNAIAVAADINQILADLVLSLALPDRVGCFVDLSVGTNAAPTGQGITDKGILNGTEGWTVTTN